MRRYHKPVLRVQRARNEAIRDRLWKVLQDEPGDYYRRVCVFCGSEVEGFLLHGKGSGAGHEYVRCLKGHYLTGDDWRIEPNED